MAVKKATVNGTMERYTYLRYFDFFEQLGMSALKDKTHFKVVRELMGGQVGRSWDAWQYVIPYVWGNQARAGLSFQALAKSLLIARCSAQCKEHRRYELLTGGLGAWARWVKMERQAWGPSGIPYEDFFAYFDSLAVITSLHRFPPGTTEAEARYLTDRPPYP